MCHYLVSETHLNFKYGDVSVEICNQCDNYTLINKYMILICIGKTSMAYLTQKWLPCLTCYRIQSGDYSVAPLVC